ncbi:glycosyltransferase family 2 protein, partial [Proteus mirabilis]
MSVYNDEKYLQESIDSILNQTFKEFEFLVINDGSTDNSLSILK